MNPFATATELLADLRAGRVSSSELTEMYIGRIEKHDERLNAVVERDFARAREQARAADLGGGGVLRGLPITLKESFNVSGLRTTCGVPAWKDFVSKHDAPTWMQLRGAGAVLLGKTNVPPMLQDWQSANAIYGRTSNPWDLGRTPGKQWWQRRRDRSGTERARGRLRHRRLHPRARGVLRRLRP